MGVACSYSSAPGRAQNTFRPVNINSNVYGFFVVLFRLFFFLSFFFGEWGKKPLGAETRPTCSVESGIEPRPHR